MTSLTNNTQTAKEISIRPADADDAMLLSVLASTCFYEAYFEQDDPRDLSAFIHDSFNVPTLEGELADPESSFYLLHRGAEAVGYAKLREGSPHHSVAREATVELQRIYVLERVWRTGVGGRLLEFCTDEAARREKESIWLGVWDQNARAQGFYLKRGFKQVGTLTFPYGNICGTNLVMRLGLTDAAE